MDREAAIATRYTWPKRSQQITINHICLSYFQQPQFKHRGNSILPNTLQNHTYRSTLCIIKCASLQQCTRNHSLAVNGMLQALRSHRTSVGNLIHTHTQNRLHQTGFMRVHRLSGETGNPPPHRLSYQKTVICCTRNLLRYSTIIPANVGLSPSVKLSGSTVTEHINTKALSDQTIPYGRRKLKVASMWHKTLGLVR